MIYERNGRRFFRINLETKLLLLLRFIAAELKVLRIAGEYGGICRGVVPFRLSLGIVCVTADGARPPCLLEQDHILKIVLLFWEVDRLGD